MAAKKSSKPLKLKADPVKRTPMTNSESQERKPKQRGTFEMGTKSRTSSNAGVKLSGKGGGGGGIRRDSKGRWA